jgi:hypothetical protein
VAHQIGLNLSKEAAIPFIEGPQGDLAQKACGRPASVATATICSQFAPLIAQQPISGGRTDRQPACGVPQAYLQLSLVLVDRQQGANGWHQTLASKVLGVGHLGVCGKERMERAGSGR